MSDDGIETAQWQPIATAPKGKKLIAGYHNSHGNWRTIMARYYLPNTLEWSDEMNVEPEDEDFAPEGWYEECENAPTINFTDEPLTHWMSLPAPPVKPIAVSIPTPAISTPAQVDDSAPKELNKETQ